jgi:hypothetical protein
MQRSAQEHGEAGEGVWRWQVDKDGDSGGQVRIAPRQ